MFSRDFRAVRARGWGFVRAVFEGVKGLED